MKTRLNRAIGAIAVCCALLSAVCLLASAGQPGKKHLRLLYWNIQNGMWAGQADNYEKFVHWVKSQNPDICVWCEGQSIWKTGTNEKMPRSDRYLTDGWGELALRYGHRYWYVSAHRDDYPQVITSRYPIKNVKRITGSRRDTLVVHGAGWAQIEVDGTTLNIVTTHAWPLGFAYGATDQEASRRLHGGNRYRAREMEYVCRQTIGSQPQSDKQLWMMMGDLNMVSRADNHAYQLPADDTAFLVCDYISSHTPYIDVIKKMHPRSFCSSTAWNKRIDFIYCNPRLMKRVARAEILTDSYTTPVRDRVISNFWHPSDHLPIVVDFKIKR